MPRQRSQPPNLGKTETTTGSNREPTIHEFPYLNQAFAKISFKKWGYAKRDNYLCDVINKCPYLNQALGQECIQAELHDWPQQTVSRAYDGVDGEIPCSGTRPQATPSMERTSLQAGLECPPEVIKNKNLYNLNGQVFEILPL